jgi:hypothetical protein
LTLAKRIVAYFGYNQDSLVLPVLLSLSLSLSFSFFGRTRVRTQGFVLANQAFYHLGHTAVPFYSDIWEKWSLKLLAWAGLEP